MALYWNDGTSLYHYGIQGQKWGIRRFQNPDGTLTEEGKKRYGASIQKLETRTKQRYYKEGRKNGKGYLFPSARTSTGKNYDNAEKQFEENVLNDKRYKALSRKAYDAEMKRILSEKPYADDDEKYEKYVNSDKYRRMEKESIAATKAKNDYVKALADNYVDIIKDAKLDDMGVRENRDIAKQFIDDYFDPWVWDENVEYNVDSYYEPGWENNKFK